MIKYSPKNTDVSKYSPADANALVCRHVRPNSPYITKLRTNADIIPSLGAWYVFLSSKTITEIETMFSANDYSFETLKSSNTLVLLSRSVGDISEFYVYDELGNVTLNIGKMLTPNTKLHQSGYSNSGVFVSTSEFTCLTMGINFVGGIVNYGTFNAQTKHSDNYFLFTVGDKDSDAEVKIHNPVLQAGDTVDLSDLTLTIQIPTTVE